MKTIGVHYFNEEKYLNHPIRTIGSINALIGPITLDQNSMNWDYFYEAKETKFKRFDKYLYYECGTLITIWETENDMIIEEEFNGDIKYYSVTSMIHHNRYDPKVDVNEKAKRRLKLKKLGID